jgi:nucleoid DNA-binding protein
MNRSELVRVVQSQVNSTGKGYFNLEESAAILDSVIDAFTQSLVVDGQLSLRGFGSINVRSHEGKTMQGLDGTMINVAPYKTVSLKASSTLKDKINGRGLAE